jgi:hypothetical protein
MTALRVLSRTITINGDIDVDIKYWTDEHHVYVAGFDESDNQVTAAVYSAEAEISDGFYGAFRDSVIESLTRTIEWDLQQNPDLHYKKAK